MSVSERQLWGAETAKAVENFPVSGERVPVSVVRWLAAIKGAAARVNAELGKLDPDVGERIATAADAIAAGEHDDQFPIDVFQTGSGTSTNTNASPRTTSSRAPCTSRRWTRHPTACCPRSRASKPRSRRRPGSSTTS
jgi:fumarate hydratase class II